MYMVDLIVYRVTKQCIHLHQDNINTTFTH